MLSPSMYNLVIGLVLCWGFGVNWWMVTHVPNVLVDNIPLPYFYLGYMVSLLAGAYMFSFSGNAFVSFIGYNLVVIPFGLVLHMIIRKYDPTLVVDAIRVTFLVTAIMLCLGSLCPEFFENIAYTLLISLGAAVTAEIVSVHAYHVQYSVLDWIMALIFCGYIGLDWGRANSIPKTLDNAVDSAAALYMDILYLFTRVLQIVGKKK